jgi:hypothetical protein
MRYVLTDDDVDPARILRPRSSPHWIADVAFAEAGPMAVVQNFVHQFRRRNLPRLRELTEQGIGFGGEVANSMFDDDLEPGDARFEGVLLTSQIYDDEVVLSRAAYKRLVDAMLALPPPED